MAFLKSLSGSGSCWNVCHYMLYDDLGNVRARSIDTHGLESQWAWWREMDTTRKIFGKFMSSPSGHGTPRDYYHFIISPAETDDATVEQARALANAWVQENFPEHEVAVVVHDDSSARIAEGKDGIAHAHVVISSVHPATGKKIQISDEAVNRLTDSLQECCVPLGLTPFGPDPARSYKKRNRGKSAQVPSWKSTAEKEIIARGDYSWKEELRVVIERTAPFCTDLSDLQRHLAPYGFGVRHMAGELLFINPEGKKIRDSYLGLDFKKNRLERFFTDVSFMAVNSKDYPSLKKELEVKGKYVSRRVPEMKELQEALDVLSVIEREGIGRVSDFAKAKEDIRRFGIDMRTELYKMRTAVESERSLFITAQIVASDFDDDLKANAVGQLAEFGYEPAEAPWLVSELKSHAERYLTMQAEVEGSAQRISDLGKAEWWAERVLHDSLMLENEERAAKGLRPYVPGPTKIVAPPKSYDSKNPPYWLLNISRGQYQKIAASNRETRRTLSKAKGCNERRLPPYIQKREQVERSIRAQAREQASSQEINHAKRFNESL